MASYLFALQIGPLIFCFYEQMHFSLLSETQMGEVPLVKSASWPFKKSEQWSQTTRLYFYLPAPTTRLLVSTSP